MVTNTLSPPVQQPAQSRVDSILRAHLRSMSNEERVEFINSLSPEQAQALYYDWELWARDKQIEPEEPWTLWLIKAGRGFGKGRAGSETTRKYAESGVVSHIGLIGPTAADARDVMLGLNPESSGLLNICPPWNKPLYEPSKRRCIWPNGVVATLYSAEEPERLRGPEHDFVWADEPAAWPNGEAVLSNMLFGLRRGVSKAIFTTTPKPSPFFRSLMKLPGIIVTEGSTYENTALSATAIERYRSQYEGTRLGRQELYGQLLVDNPDALWTEEMINVDRITEEEYLTKIDRGLIQIKRTVVAIDPAVTATTASNETGIITCAIDNQKPRPHAYVLRDSSMVGRPDQWARRAIRDYHYFEADRLIAEVNNGGDLVQNTIANVDRRVAYADVRASKGKILRAEPISALYERHQVHHVGSFALLEQQMTDYPDENSKSSPDRLDALVWALTNLMLGKNSGKFLSF